MISLQMQRGLSILLMSLTGIASVVAGPKGQPLFVPSLTDSARTMNEGEFQRACTSLDGQLLGDVKVTQASIIPEGTAENPSALCIVSGTRHPYLDLEVVIVDT